MIRRLLPLFLVTLAACSSVRFTPDAGGGFQLITSGAERYYVYAPSNWSAEQSWPVIVYLHGASERGNNPLQPVRTGMGPVVWRSKGTFPAVVVFPQAPDDSFWGMPENNKRVITILDEVMAKYHGDPTRVYLTGNSLGGFGTWFLAGLYPERWAALVPICGGVRGRAPRPDAPFAAVAEADRPGEIARRIGKTPVWIFHGKSDWLVPVAYSREMDKALREAGGDVRYTEYPGVGHNSWDRTYANPKLFEWLFQQHR